MHEGVASSHSSSRSTLPGRILQKEVKGFPTKVFDSNSCLLIRTSLVTYKREIDKPRSHTEQGF